MKKQIAILVAGISLLLAGGWSLAQEVGGVQSLRGAQVDELVSVEEAAKQDKQRFTRAYRLQPPLVPHAIGQYQIDLSVNQCLGCHDWSNAGDRNAPTLSMTHYLGRDGRQLDEVAGTRWFCNQCHVPQANTEPLVENSFIPSFRR